MSSGLKIINGKSQSEERSQSNSGRKLKQVKDQDQVITSSSEDHDQGGELLGSHNDPIKEARSLEVYKTKSLARKRGNIKDCPEYEDFRALSFVVHSQEKRIFKKRSKKKAKNKQIQAREGKDQVKSKSKVIRMKKIQLEGLKLPSLKLYYKVEFGQWRTEQERFISWNTDHLSQLLAHHHIDHTRYDGTRYSYVPDIPDLGVQHGVNFMSGTPGYSTAPSPFS
ncbi:hypothetical protein Tco_0486918 [Tanacetum coccineum]